MWSPEKTNELIEFFREKKVLWDPTDADFKDRNKKHDAWYELAAACSVSRDEAEAKTRKLIGQFQRELRKGKRGGDAPYKTKWSYFQSLSFLKDKYEQRHRREAAMDSLQADNRSEDTSQSSNHEQQATSIINSVFESSVPESPSILSVWGSNSDKPFGAIRAECKDDTTAEEAYSQEVKNKWKGLRDVFRRELKKAQPDDSGDPLYVPKWPCYESMCFLKDSMSKRETSRRMSAEGDESHGDPLLEAETHSMPSPHSHVVFEPPPSKRVKTEDELSNEPQPRFEVEERRQNHFTDCMQDSDALFLMSLLPFLKNVPPSRQLAVRTNLLQVFSNEQTTQQYLD